MGSASRRPVDRYWLLTWSTYGNRVPGDRREFVSSIREGLNDHVIHNVPGTPFDADMPALSRYSKRIMKGDPIRLNEAQAFKLLEQFEETTDHRAWTLFAVAIMAV